jgi:hypothetical protein
MNFPDDYSAKEMSEMREIERSIPVGNIPEVCTGYQDLKTQMLFPQQLPQ